MKDQPGELPDAQQKRTSAFSLESMSGAVRGEIGTVCVAQAAERGGSVKTEGLAGDRTQCGARTHCTVMGEADQALVERPVPEGREQEAAVDIEALLVVAVGPGHDV
jgi:hypothetical protein